MLRTNECTSIAPYNKVMRFKFSSRFCSFLFFHFTIINPNGHDHEVRAQLQTDWLGWIREKRVSRWASAEEDEMKPFLSRRQGNNEKNILKDVSCCDSLLPFENEFFLLPRILCSVYLTLRYVCMFVFISVIISV